MSCAPESCSFQAAGPPSFNYLFQKRHNFIGKNQCSLTKLELYEKFNLVFFKGIMLGLIY